MEGHGPQKCPDRNCNNRLPRQHLEALDSVASRMFGAVWMGALPLSVAILGIAIPFRLCSR
eukprot:9848769-Alexandrium_andersonii.AAC.1